MSIWRMFAPSSCRLSKGEGEKNSLLDSPSDLRDLRYAVIVKNLFYLIATPVD